MENANEKLIRYLQDAHAAEVGIRKMLEGFASDTQDPAIKSLFDEHVHVTRTHEDRISECLTKFNEEPSNGKGFLNSMMAKISELVQSAHDENDKNTQHLIKAFATEQLECAMYESLISYARAVGDQDVVNVATAIQAEEKATADRIWPLISQYAIKPLQNVKAPNAAYTA